jgi:sulfonate transport system substrate-binding protein
MSAASTMARSTIPHPFCPGRRRGDRLCGRPADYQRSGHPGPEGFSIAELKGSSAHNIVVQTLEKAGLTYADITPVYLTPPDAGPAFANGSIDAWLIWDPYFAIGETKQNGRILVNAREVIKSNSFHIANRDFARSHGPILQQIVDVTTATAR